MVQLVEALHYIIGSVLDGIIWIFHWLDPTARLWPWGQLHL